MRILVLHILLCLFISTLLIASDRFIVNDSTGIIIDTETNLEWFFAPNIETDWFEAFVWLEELDEEWRCPTIDELSKLHEAGISFDVPAPFVLGGNWIWCGDLSNYDSVYCFNFISGGFNRIATWRAYEYITGLRAMAVRSPVN